MKNFYIFGICTAAIGLLLNAYMILKPMVQWEQGTWLMFVAVCCVFMLINGIFSIQYLVFWSDEKKRNNLLLAVICCNACYWLVTLSPLIIQCLKVVFYTK